MAQKANDPYQVLLKQNKLPMSLLTDPTSKQHAAKIHVETEPFAQTFGPKAQRKRPKLAVSTLEDLVGECEQKDKKYEETLEMKLLLSGKSSEQTAEEVGNGWIQEAKEPIFTKGTSKRIWNELYKVIFRYLFKDFVSILTHMKVIDSSDVVIHVLDARDPLGTRCRSVEKYIREEAPHKHLIFVLNKCDLVPTSVAVCLSFFFLLPHLSFALPSGPPVPSFKSRHHRGRSPSGSSSSFFSRRCLLQHWESKPLSRLVIPSHVLWWGLTPFLLFWVDSSRDWDVFRFELRSNCFLN